VSARAAFARIVYEDQAMNDLGFFQSNVFTSNSVDTPKDLNEFIVIVDGGADKAFGTTGATVVTYWVHRSRRAGVDYGPIDLALMRLREILVDVQHFAGGDGWVLSGASWVDQSPDLDDEAFNTITKFVTFRAAVRNVVTT
jgi:hypothetical protein